MDTAERFLHSLFLGPCLAVLAFASAEAVQPLLSPRVAHERGTTVQNAQRVTERSAAQRSVAAEEQPATLLALGDVMLGRYVETLMARQGDDYPFVHLDALTASADLTFANLEGPIPDAHRQTPTNSLRFSFPPDTPRVLAAHGIGAVSLANNHTADQGSAGYEATQTRLADAGVASFGNPLDENGPVFSTVVREQGIVLLGFHATNSRFVLADAVDAVEHERAADDFLIVSIHWGAEYAATASAAQRTIAHALVDAGADTVLGHHPHVVQDVERYRGRLIIYSLGNAIFDQYFAAATQQELAVRIALTPTSVQYDLLPLQSVRSKPRPMEEPARSVFLASLAARSDAAIAEAVRTGTVTLTRSL